MRISTAALLLMVFPSGSLAQDTLTRVEKRCAHAAAHVVERLRIDDEAVGVQIEEINVRSALRHCKKAVRRNASVQNEFRLARAYLADAENPEYLDLARALFESAADRGYAPAQLSLGYILLNRDPTDASRAALNFDLAYKAGIGEARAALAHAWGFGANTKEHRGKAVEIFTELGVEDPKYMLYGGEVLLQRMDDRKPRQLKPCCSTRSDAA